MCCWIIQPFRQVFLRLGCNLQMDLRPLLMCTHTGREAVMWKNECPIGLGTSQKISTKRLGLGTKWFSWMSAQPGDSSLLCDHEIRLGQKGQKWTTALSVPLMSCVIRNGGKTPYRFHTIDIVQVLRKSEDSVSGFYVFFFLHLHKPVVS